MTRTTFKTLCILPWDTSTIVSGGSLCPQIEVPAENGEIDTLEVLERCETELIVREKTLSGQAMEEAGEGADKRINLKLFRYLLRAPGSEHPQILPHDSANIARFCQHLLVYRFFDICNRLNDFEEDVALHARQRFKIEKSFYRRMNNWVDVVKDARRVFSLESMASTSSPVIDTPSTSAEHMFNTLSTVSALSEQSSRNALSSNMLLAAFHIRYLMDGHLDLPDNYNQFYDSIARNLSRPRPSGWNRTTQQLRFPLQIALAISPICLLLPKLLSTVDFNREHLLLAWQALGNMRPEAVRLVEDCIWRSLSRLAAGSVNYMTEIASLIHKIQNHVEFVSDNDAGWLAEDPTLPYFQAFELRTFAVQTVPDDWPSRVYLLSTQGQQGGQPGENFLAGEGAIPLSNEGGHGHETPEDVDMEDADGGVEPPSGSHTPASDESGVDNDKDTALHVTTLGKRHRNRSPEFDEEGLDVEPPAKRYDVRLPVARQPVTRGKAALRMDKRKHNRAAKSPVVARVQAAAGITDYIDLTVEWTPRNGNLHEVAMKNEPSKIPTAHTLYGAVGGMRYASRLPFDADQDFLSDTVKSVCSFFSGGKPRHISDPQSSAFYIIKYEEFLRLITRDIQRIYRERHIVVTGIPQEAGFVFDRQRLEQLGSWVMPRDIQDLTIPVENGNYQSRVRRGSFKDIWEHSRQQDGRILNCLDIPHPNGAPTDDRLASDTKAWVATIGHPLCGKKIEFPVHESRWALAATAHTLHRWHIDAEGVGTSIEVKTGAKWWAVARPRHEKADFVNLRDQNLWSFEPDDQNESLWDHEAIVLTPGMMLFMRPNTPHVTVTIDHAICYGTHFIATGALRQTCFGLIHSFVRRDVITNAENRKVWFNLQRLLIYYREVYLESYLSDPGVDLSHVPCCEELDGAMDLVTFCSVMEIGLALYPGYYDDEGILAEDWQRFVYAKLTARHVMEWFDAHYRYEYASGGSPMGLYETMLLSMSVTLIGYLEKQRGWDEDVLEEDGELDTPPIEATLYEILEVLSGHPIMEELIDNTHEYYFDDFDYPGQNFEIGAFVKVERPNYTPPAIDAEPELEWDRLTVLKKARAKGTWPAPRITVDEFMGRDR